MNEEGRRLKQRRLVALLRTRHASIGEYALLRVVRLASFSGLGGPHPMDYKFSVN